jgi:hypothetical protein
MIARTFIDEYPDSVAYTGKTTSEMNISTESLADEAGIQRPVAKYPLHY